MAINVTIKQNAFDESFLPVKVILGDKLSFGIYEGEKIVDGLLGNNKVLVFNPRHVGRGFSCASTDEETFELVLPIPTTTYEINDFYDAVERICQFLDGDLTVDGEELTINEFLERRQQAIEGNRGVIKSFASQILEEDKQFGFPAVFDTFTPTKDEAKDFLKCSTNFNLWLHRKQKEYLK